MSPAKPAVEKELTQMERARKLELIQRSLGIRHKLKVHDSMKLPDTHEELSVMMLARWELEDELRAIEEMVADIRSSNVALKRNAILKEKKPLKKKDKY